MNVIVWLELKLVYYDAPVQHVSDFVIEIPPCKNLYQNIWHDLSKPERDYRERSQLIYPTEKMFAVIYKQKYKEMSYIYHGYTCLGPIYRSNGTIQSFSKDYHLLFGTIELCENCSY